MLTREQVEEIIDHYELVLSKVVGSDGVDASNLLKHDAAQRTRIEALEAVYTAVSHVWHKAMIHIDDETDQRACDALRLAIEQARREP